MLCIYGRSCLSYSDEFQYFYEVEPKHQLKLRGVFYAKFGYVSNAMGAQAFEPESKIIGGFDTSPVTTILVSPDEVLIFK